MLQAGGSKNRGADQLIRLYAVSQLRQEVLCRE